MQVLKYKCLHCNAEVPVADTCAGCGRKIVGVGSLTLLELARRLGPDKEVFIHIRYFNDVPCESMIVKDVGAPYDYAAHQHEYYMLTEEETADETKES